MIALLVVIGALAVGKIHGQDTVASFVINTQAAASSTNRRLAELREISRELQPSLLPQPSFQERDRLEQRNRNNFSVPSRTLVREYEPKTIIIAVTKLPDRMELPSNITNGSRRPNTNNNATRNNTRRKEDLAERNSSPKPVQPVRPKNETSRDNSVLPDKPLVVSSTPTTNVTFDERANFDGDQCPTGFVRVNGKCVEED